MAILKNDENIVCPTKVCLPLSYSLCESALNGIVFVMQLLNMAAITFKTASDFEISSNFLLCRTVSLELSIQR